MNYKTLRLPLWGLSIIALLIGAWGAYERITVGHESTAYGSYVVWGLGVAMYLYFVELAAGAHLFATMEFISGYKPFLRLYRLALAVALAAIVGGLLNIWSDLGRPERFWEVYLRPNPNSVMAFMVWAYTLFIVVLLAQMLIEFRPEWMRALGKTYSSQTQMRDRKILRILMILSVPMVIAFSGGVGALFGVQGARPYWHVGMYPVAFIVTALVSGAGMMTFLAAFFIPDHDEEHQGLMSALRRLLAIFLVAEGLFVFADYSISLYGALPPNVAAIRQVLTGQYWWAFWIIQVLIGMVIPFVIAVTPGLGRNTVLTGLAGILVVFGFVAVRINVVLPALTVPEIEALRTAFADPRLGFTYFPSVGEWALAIGITGVVATLFLLAYERLPLLKTEVA
jgi:molybdopterin-containing oxidoreductase family membrane subunit